MDLQCELCPKGCLIKPGQSGECRVRVNLDGKLVAVTYGFPSAVHVDPVEKKPLFHFLPATGTFSLATVGCNLHCKNCQNWEISQANPEESEAVQLLPEAIPGLARQYGCLSVSYTYTDPIIYYEYTLDGCIRSREAGLRNVLVTAGYINRPPWEELLRYVDAITLDVKSISDQFYREICNATLAPVQTSLVVAKTLGVHVEVSNLVIPTLNDKDRDFRGLCKWVVGNLGRETPFHFLRFFPQYQMKNLPPTPAETLQRAKRIAESEGLRYVYIGNLIEAGAENTYCHKCKLLLIERQGYLVVQNKISSGKCPQCHTEVYGVWH